MIVVILFLAAVARLILLTQPTIIWWDAAMYTGMGKFIFTNGQLGVWEVFRPVLWPAVLGLFWKFGIDPLVAGKAIVFLASLLIIYFVYKIGEEIRLGAGLYASILLSFTGIFFFYTVAPLTDLPSLFFAVHAVWLAIRKRYWSSGLNIGVAFVLRFPQALVLALICLGLLLHEISFQESKWYKKIIKQWLWLGIGFACIAIPYFALNIFMYHDPLLPIIAGNRVFSLSVSQSNSVWFYIWNAFIQNPLFIIAAAVVGMWLIRFKTTNRNRNVVMVVVIALGLVLYYSLQSHRELRYMLAFMPFIALLSGYGLSLWLGTAKRRSIIVMIVMLGYFMISGYYFANHYLQQFEPVTVLDNYYHFFSSKPGSKIVTSSPQIVAVADVKISEIFDTWQDAPDAIIRLQQSVDYIAINSCEIRCAETGTNCTEAQEQVKNIVAPMNHVFSNSYASCSLDIYQAVHAR